MKIKKIQLFDEEYILIDNRYALYSDGIIYDTLKNKDIPQWIFEFRDFVLENYKTMYK